MLAQLVERFNGIEEVIGSIPLHSTTFPLPLRRDFFVQRMILSAKGAKFREVGRENFLGWEL